MYAGPGSPSALGCHASYFAWRTTNFVTVLVCIVGAPCEIQFSKCRKPFRSCLDIMTMQETIIIAFLLLECKNHCSSLEVTGHQPGPRRIDEDFRLSFVATFPGRDADLNGSCLYP